MKPTTAKQGDSSGWVERAGVLLANDRLRTVLASGVLVLNLGLLIVFLFSSYKGYFHSDSSVRNLLAQEMHDTGSFFPPGWNYVNKDLMVLFAQLGVWPLLFFFENSYTLFAVSGVVVAGIILASVWWFTGMLEATRWQRVLALAVLAGGVSAAAAEDTFGQAAYGIPMALTCLVALFGWRSISDVPKRRPLWLVLAFVLVFLVSWSNPQRAAASYLLPFFFGLLLYVWGERWASRVPDVLPVLAVSVIGFGMGFALSIHTLARVNNIAGAGRARWLDFDGMVSNFVDTLHGLMALLGGVPVSGSDVLNGVGIYAALRLFAALMLLALIGWRIAKLCASRSASVRMAAGVVAGMGICFLFLQVTTTVADMADPVTAARYMTPTVMLGLMLLICTPLTQISRITSAVVLGLAILLASNSLMYLSHDSMVYPGRSNTQREALLAQLRSLGLHYGYASYWNSGALTVLSGGDVKVRQVNIYGGMPVPMRHLSSDRWYEREAWRGETFLLLDEKAVAALDWSSLTRYAGQPIKEVDVEGMKVFVFGKNLAAVLPNWSGLLREPFRMSAVPDGAHTVGRWDDASRTLQASVGESGFLQYGPYRPLNRGRYSAAFEVSGVSDPADKLVAKIDAATSNGSVILGSSEVIGDGRDRHTFEFTVDHSLSDLEFRVWTTGNGKVAYKGMTLSPIP